MRERLVQQQFDKNGYRELLIKHFNVGELQDLCADLDVEYEIIVGQNKADKARELVNYVSRHGITDKFMNRCQELRPLVDWPVHASINQSPGSVEPLDEAGKLRTKDIDRLRNSPKSWMFSGSRIRNAIPAIILFIVVGFILVLFIRSFDLSAKITYPEDGESVPEKIYFKGTSINIPADKDLWLYIRVPESGLYFFTPISSPPNGPWKTGDITIGLPADKGRQFEAGVFVVNTTDSNTLRQALIGKLNDLPSSRRILDTISIYR